MAVGDKARAKNLATIDGATALVINGDDEINATRDMIADILDLIPAVWPLAKGGTGSDNAAGARTSLGICGSIGYGTGAPVGGNNGDIYLKYTP